MKSYQNYKHTILKLACKLYIALKSKELNGLRAIPKHRGAAAEGRRHPCRRRNRETVAQYSTNAAYKNAFNYF